jgi:hypothetical protein
MTTREMLTVKVVGFMFHLRWAYQVKLDFYFYHPGFCGIETPKCSNTRHANLREQKKMSKWICFPVMEAITIQLIILIILFMCFGVASKRNKPTNK